MKHLLRFNENISDDKYKTLADVLTDIFDRHDIEFYDRGNTGRFIGNNKWEYWYKNNTINRLTILNITESKAYQIEFDLREIKSKLSNFGISIKWSIEEGDEYTEDDEEHLYYIEITVSDIIKESSEISDESFFGVSRQDINDIFLHFIDNDISTKIKYLLVPKNADISNLSYGSIVEYDYDNEIGSKNKNKAIFIQLHTRSKISEDILINSDFSREIQKMSNYGFYLVSDKSHKSKSSVDSTNRRLMFYRGATWDK